MAKVLRVYLYYILEIPSQHGMGWSVSANALLLKDTSSGPESSIKSKFTRGGTLDPLTLAGGILIANNVMHYRCMLCSFTNQFHAAGTTASKIACCCPG